MSQRLIEAEGTYNQAREAARQEGADQSIRYFFSKPDGSEMRSRWDMQDSPPDILITNFSMLSVMLMREADDPIFARTRAWLEVAKRTNSTSWWMSFIFTAERQEPK